MTEYEKTMVEAVRLVAEEIKATREYLMARDEEEKREKEAMAVRAEKNDLAFYEKYAPTRKGTLAGKEDEQHR